MGIYYNNKLIRVIDSNFDSNGDFCKVEYQDTPGVFHAVHFEELQADGGLVELNTVLSKVREIRKIASHNRHFKMNNYDKFSK